VTVTEQAQPVTGHRFGPAPYGWERDRRTLALLPIPREQAVRWLILHMRAEGWSLRRISAELDHLRIPTRVGLRSWPVKSLARIVNAPAGDAEANVAAPG
jgi:hypothetical protein